MNYPVLPADDLGSSWKIQAGKDPSKLNFINFFLDIDTKIILKIRF